MPLATGEQGATAHSLCMPSGKCAFLRLCRLLFLPGLLDTENGLMLAFGRERAQLFGGEAFVPLGVPLLGSGAICMVLQLLMDVNGVSRSWAQHIWKAVIPFILLWGEGRE